MFYVFVALEYGTRRLVRVNVTENKTARWMLRQLREIVGEEGGRGYLIHDRDCIF